MTAQAILATLAQTACTQSALLCWIAPRRGGLLEVTGAVTALATAALFSYLQTEHAKRARTKRRLATAEYATAVVTGVLRSHEYAQRAIRSGDLLAFPIIAMHLDIDIEAVRAFLTPSEQDPRTVEILQAAMLCAKITKLAVSKIADELRFRGKAPLEVVEALNGGTGDARALLEELIERSPELERR